MSEIAQRLSNSASDSQYGSHRGSFAILYQRGQTNLRDVVHNRSYSLCSASVPATVLTLLVLEMVSEGAVNMAESDLTTYSRRLNLFDLSPPYFYFANSGNWSKHS